MDQPPTRRVVPLRWYPTHTHEQWMPHALTIGLVALLDEDREGPYFKVYIGVSTPTMEQLDAEEIATQGAPLHDEVMARHLCGKHAEGRVYRR